MSLRLKYDVLYLLLCTWTSWQKPSGVYLAADLSLLFCHQITSLRLCLEKKQCDFVGKSVFSLWPAYLLQWYQTLDNNISTETFQTEQFIQETSLVSSDHDSLENTAHRGGITCPLFNLLGYSVYVGYCVFMEIVSYYCAL